jgi:hypothetical protein
MDGPPNADSLDFDLLAASLRADGSDLEAFVESLASKLNDVLPGRVRVQRRRDGMLGPKRVARIVVDAGGERLELARTGDEVQTFRALVSGGITLKNEPLATDAWLEALTRALAAEAERSATTRRALERLLTR